jgi:hypothetical protein
MSLCRRCWCRSRERTATTTGKRDEGGVGEKGERAGSRYFSCEFVVPTRRQKGPRLFFRQGRPRWAGVAQRRDLQLRCGRVAARELGLGRHISRGFRSLRVDRRVRLRAAMYVHDITQVRGVRGCSPGTGAAAPDVALTSRGGDRRLYDPPGSGDQQASPSLSGGSVHPSQRRGKTGHCGGPEQGAPCYLCFP